MGSLPTHEAHPMPDSQVQSKGWLGTTWGAQALGPSSPEQRGVTHRRGWMCRSLRDTEH